MFLIPRLHLEGIPTTLTHRRGAFQLVLHQLDDLDIRIIKELGSPNSPQWNVRESYANIARKIGIDEETVRKRLKRAKELGSLPSLRIMINPLLIGCEAAGIDLEMSDEENKEKAISEIRLIDGVVIIHDFHGKGLQVTLYCENEDSLRRKTELISSICGSSNPVVWKLGFPRPDVRMTRTDWKIIKSMEEDARKSLQVVARQVGTSVRTIERRLTLMKEGRATYLTGTPNFKMVAGLSCNLLVFCEDAGKKSAADTLILSELSRIDFSNTDSRNYSTFAVVCNNASEADDALRWIRGLDGVKSARMRIMKEMIVVQDWLSSEIRKRL